MKIGNWTLDEEKREIIWTGKGNSRIVLGNDNFFGLGLEKFIGDLIYICEKDIIKDSDIFALNTVLMIAFEEFDINKPEGFTFSELIKRQIEIISEKGNNIDYIVL